MTPGPTATLRSGLVAPFVLWPVAAALGLERADDDARSASEAARTVAEAIEVTRDVDGQRTVCEMLPHPLHKFGDPVRVNTDGTVWAWGTTGRPEAVLELYFNDEGSRIQVVSSLSDRPLSVEGGDGFRWTPDPSGVALVPAPGGRAPAEQPAARLRQMREIARGLTAHEFWDPDNQRYELRLLPPPVHRYSDPEGGLLDGAMFFFAHGTNPEVVMLIEAREEGDAHRWKCTFARLGHAEMHVVSGEEDLWNAERVERPEPTEPYWLFYKAGAAGGQ